MSTQQQQWRISKLYIFLFWRTQGVARERESKSWKSQKNRYKFIIRTRTAREEVLFLAFHAGRRKDKKKQQQRENQNYSILSSVWMRLATVLAQTGGALNIFSCQSNIFFRFWVLAFGFGLTFACLFFHFAIDWMLLFGLNGMTFNHFVIDFSFQRDVCVLSFLLNSEFTPNFRHQKAILIKTTNT